MVPGIEIIPVSSLLSVISYFKTKKTEDAKKKTAESGKCASKAEQPDFAELHGQGMLKRACEVAVAGMHNLLMVGPRKNHGGKADPVDPAADEQEGADRAVKNIQCLWAV